MSDSLLNILSARVETSPNTLLFRRLNMRNGTHETLTYAELYEQVLTFAAGIAEISAPGDRVILTFPSSNEFIIAFLGCLATRRIPVPHAVLRKDASADRLTRIVDDCSAALSIAPLDIAEKLESLIKNRCNHRVFSFEAVMGAGHGGISVFPANPEDIAFLQYTSGSTGKPKGVIVTHANLNANLQQIKTALPTDLKHLVSWLPQFHDMGLVGATLAPIYTNAACSFFSPSEFILRPLRWLTALSELRADVSVAPNFGYAYLLQRCDPNEFAHLDLSHVRILMTGAEPVKAETLRRFREALNSTGLHRDVYFPTYGLAEATLFATGGPNGQRIATARLSQDGQRCLPDTNEQEGIEVVSCGSPGAGIDVNILEPQYDVPVAPGKVGEICIQGENITLGYWGQSPDDSDKRMLRTGDLGFMKDGELYVTGRLKDLIILRGRNIYPQDLESLSQKCVPGSSENSCAAVMQAEDLILVQEVSRTVRDKDVHASIAIDISTRISEIFEVRIDRIILTQPNNIPRTTSGKISRSSLALKLLAGEFPTIYDTANKALEQL